MDYNAKRGHDFIGVSAVALVHDGKGNLLLQQRGPKARDEQGTWDLCGGAIEFGDTIEETIRKELKEELLTKPISMQFLTAYDAHRTIKNKPTHWVAIVYAVQVEPLTVAIGEPDKISALGWFTAKSLPSPMHSQFNKAFKAAHDQGIIV